MANSHSRPTVLLVDDDPRFREELTEFLEPRVGRMVSTGDEREARRRLVHEAFDLLLLDLKLKDGDGIDLIGDVFAETERKPAIVVISGLDKELRESASSLANSLGAVVIDQMGKPVDLERLDRLIEIEPWKRLTPRPAAGVSLERGEVLHGLAHGAVRSFFQPQYDLRSGRLVGFEALARWYRKLEGDILGPAAFKDYLESGESAWSFFREMLLRSVEIFAKLESNHRPEHLAINVSANVFGDERFLETIRETMMRYGLPPSTLTLELTETFDFLDQAALLGIVRARVRGFGVSLDDFGKGAANLECLARLPLTEVKLDQWFLQNSADGKGYQFIRSIAGICIQRDIRVVVEGIETPDQLELATELGFHVGQGFWLGHPVPAEEAIHLPRCHPKIVGRDRATGSVRRE
ncbi:EAL domain-containing protein [Guyparkeria sp.]|uniref:EAL domain-containing response regulator n=1 Tax=Guyparkeria sp. TaxID=2035736 RepID=UPI003970938E